MNEIHSKSAATVTTAAAADAAADKIQITLIDTNEVYCILYDILLLNILMWFGVLNRIECNSNSTVARSKT